MKLSYVDQMINFHCYIFLVCTNKQYLPVGKNAFENWKSHSSFMLLLFALFNFYSLCDCEFVFCFFHLRWEEKLQMLMQILYNFAAD